MQNFEQLFLDDFDKYRQAPKICNSYFLTLIYHIDNESKVIRAKAVELIFFFFENNFFSSQNIDNNNINLMLAKISSLPQRDERFTILQLMVTKQTVFMNCVKEVSNIKIIYEMQFLYFQEYVEKADKEGIINLANQLKEKNAEGKCFFDGIKETFDDTLINRYINLCREIEIKFPDIVISNYWFEKPKCSFFPFGFTEKTQPVIGDIWQSSDYTL